MKEKLATAAFKPFHAGLRVFELEQVTVLYFFQFFSFSFARKGGEMDGRSGRGEGVLIGIFFYFFAKLMLVYKDKYHQLDQGSVCG